nr:MAG TPA: Lines C-terminus [Caudoviricetes sp.]
MPASPVKSRACVYFIGYNNLVDPMGIQILRRPGLFPYRNSPLLLR